MIVTQEIKHTELSQFVSVSKVDLSSDKAYATVWVSSFIDDKKLNESVEALQRASGFIQSRLRKILKTRNTPKITFKADLSIKEGQAINNLIDSLNIKDE